MLSTLLLCPCRDLLYVCPPFLSSRLLEQSFQQLLQGLIVQIIGVSRYKFFWTHTEEIMEDAREIAVG